MLMSMEVGTEEDEGGEAVSSLLDMSVRLPFSGDVDGLINAGDAHSTSKAFSRIDLPSLYFCDVS